MERPSPSYSYRRPHRFRMEQRRQRHDQTRCRLTYQQLLNVRRAFEFLMEISSNRAISVNDLNFAETYL